MDRYIDTTKVYHINGVFYSIAKSLGYQQCQWLAAHVLTGADLLSLDAASLHDVICTKGPLVMAICLIEDGATRSQHNALSWETITARARQFAAELSPEEVIAFEVPFFLLLSPASIAVMTPGQMMQQLWHETSTPSPVPSGNGSSTVSSPSVEETSHELLTSSPNGDRPSPSPISVAASSAPPSTEPSLDSAGCNSHG